MGFCGDDYNACAMIALPPPRQILTSAAAVLAFVALAALGGCGQSGALYLPQTPPGVERATLPEAVFGLRATGAAPAEDAASAPRPAILPDDDDFDDDNSSVPLLP